VNLQKTVNILFVVFFAAQTVQAQTFTDPAIGAASIDLQQVLRISVTGGGNLEFVINSIAQYETGINAGGANIFYQTDFEVASSTRWDLRLNADGGLPLSGSDNPANTMALDNIGLRIVTQVGAVHTFGVELTDPAGANAAVIALPAAATIVVGSALVAPTNEGTITDNAFTIQWRVGTTEGGGMNAVPLIDQDLASDRYVTNIILDIGPLP